MKNFYVGIPNDLKPEEQVKILVVPEANGWPSNLKNVRRVTAATESDAAVLYMKLFGVRAKMVEKN